MSMDPNPSPKSKIQNPKSKIQNPKSKTQNPKSKIQNPKSKIQNPKSKRGRLGPPQKERRLNRSKIQNPKSEIQNPKSKIRNPKSKIRNPKSKIQNPNSKLQTPKSKIQTPNSKLQNPNGPFGVWILDFGFGRAGAGGDGHVANEDVWPRWPPELGLVGGTQACNRKVAGSISGETAGQAALLETLGQHRAKKKRSKPFKIYLYLNNKHYIQILFYAIHHPWSNATNLSGRRLTGASLFKSGDAQGI